MGYKRIFKKRWGAAGGMTIHKTWQTWAPTGAHGHPRIPRRRIVGSRVFLYRMVQCSSRLHTLSRRLERNTQYSFKLKKQHPISWSRTENVGYHLYPFWGKLTLLWHQTRCFDKYHNIVTGHKLRNDGPGPQFLLVKNTLPCRWSTFNGDRTDEEKGNETIKSDWIITPTQLSFAIRYAQRNFIILSARNLAYLTWNKGGGQMFSSWYTQGLLLRTSLCESSTIIKFSIVWCVSYECVSWHTES